MNGRNLKLDRTSESSSFPAMGVRDEPSVGEQKRAHQAIWQGLKGDAERPLFDDRYVIGPAIGFGGLGRVYRAQDKKLGREVALKFLRHRSTAQGNSEVLLREAQVLAKLQHPNVVGIHDVGEAGDELYLSMELVPGVALSTWLQERPRTVNEILVPLRQAAHGLAAAHEAGVIHRDFKPANVVCGADGRTRVIDFGLAQPREADTAIEPTPGRGNTIAGTRRYMAPEQFKGVATPASDQFAFCVSLFQALTGQLPWAKERLGLRTGADTRRLRQKLRQAGVPRWLCATVLLGLHYDRRMRASSMRELSIRLEAPRGRWFFTSAATTSVGLAIWWAATPSPCERRGSTASLLWLPERAARIQRALSVAGPKIVDPVIESVDRFVADWNAADLAACQQHANGETSIVLDKIRHRCMMQAWERVDYLLDQVEKIDTKAMARVPAAVTSTTDFFVCQRDEDLLRGSSEPSHDAVLGEQIQRGIDRAYVHGQLGDSSRLIHDLVSIRDSVEDRSLALPDMLWLSMHLGSALNTQQRFGEAEEVILPALLESEGHPAWTKQTGALRTQLSAALVNQPGRADAAYLVASQAVAAAASLGNDHRHEMRAQAALAAAALSLGKNKVATRAIARALEIEANHTHSGAADWPGLRSTLAEVLAHQGNALLTAGRSDDAVKSYKRALGALDEIAYRGPARASVLNNLGLALRSSNPASALQASQAAAELQTALGDSTRAATSWMNAGNTLARIDRKEEALKLFSLALETAGRDAYLERTKILLNRGLLLQRLQRWDEARHDFEQALISGEVRNHAEPGVMHDLAIGLGQVLLAQGATEAAEDVLERALHREPPRIGDYARAELRIALATALKDKKPAVARQLVNLAILLAEAAGDPALRSSGVRVFEELGPGR